MKAFILSTCVHAILAAPQVDVPGVGSLRGMLSNDSDAVAKFMNIPYAAPPLGALRWQPPQPHVPWEGVRDAGLASYNTSKFCWQVIPGVDPSLYRDMVSEDCLLLHVATPVAALHSDSRLPVMFWIHGGGYTFGSGYDSSNDALVLHSALKTMVVSLNYRLNVFGFLGSSELQHRAEDGSTGNLGIQDQRFAMQWVRDHAHAFGGNGDDITIFGQSAGGVSVWMHLVQSPSFGLYTKAIMESGTGGTVTSFAKAEEEYAKLLNGTDCPNSACLIDVESERLVRAVIATGLDAGGSWAPVIDNVSLLMPPGDHVAHGLCNTKVPIMIGSNRDENAAFTIQNTIRFPANMTESDFDSWFKAAQLETNPQLSVPKSAALAQVKRLYDPQVYSYPADLGPYTRWWWTATRVLTDKVPSLGACGVRWLARLFESQGSPAVFTYLYAHPSEDSGDILVPHSAEIGYVFESGPFASASEVELADKMSAYWQVFAETGEPKRSDLLAWPAFTAESDTVLRLDAAPTGIHLQHGLRKSACDYWESLESLTISSSEEAVV